MANAASGVVGAVAAVAEAIASLLHWWELRQSRLHRERREETDQRLSFVTDLLDRWILEHSTNDHVDLTLSHYLARECLGLLRFAGDTKNVLVPHALLYEIERVRQIVAGVREMVVRQFLALEASGISHVASPVDDQAVLQINYHALFPFFRSPTDEWSVAVETKKVREFETDLHNLSRNPQRIIERVFVTTEPQAVALAAAISPTATLLRSTAANAAINLSTAAHVVSVLAVPSYFVLSAVLDRWNEEKAIERKDAVRELILFASEVERTHLLVRTWNILNQTVRATRGAGLLTLEDEDGKSVIAAVAENGKFTTVERARLTGRLLLPVARLSSSDALVLPPARED